MSSLQVVFAAFDERRGPVPIYYNSTQDLATKVAVKSIVSTLSQITTDTAEKIEGEAIIPFPDEKLVGFIYYTSLDEKIITGDRRVISLSCLAPSDKVNILYQNAPMLSGKAREIAVAINQKFKYGTSLEKEIEDDLASWGTIEAKEVVEEVKEKIGLFDIFAFFQPQKEFRSGRRRTADPIALFLLSFLYNAPVVLVGPDPRFLLDIAGIMDEVFEMKELRIQLTIPIGDDATGWTHKIPRADIVALTSDQFKRSFFSKDPIMIITTDGELKTPNHNYDDNHINYVNEWLKKARDMKNPDFAMRTIQLEITNLTKKLEQLVQLAASNRQSDFKEVCKLLSSSQVEVEILVEVIKGFKYISMDKINKLLKPGTRYKDIWIQGPTTIGFIR